MRTHGDNKYIIDPKTNCWNWPTNKKVGRQSIKRGGKYMIVYRYFYEKYKGEIPKGLEIDHLCFNKNCVNPDHLEAVTHTQNIRRRKITKMNRESVETIKSLYPKLSQSKIAKLYNINQSTVSRLINHKRWEVL